MSIPEVPQDPYYPLIVVIDGVEQGKEYSFVDFITVGRGSNNNIQLKEPKVSRKHSQISLEGNQYWVEDLSCVGKTGNGTFVNDQAVSRQVLQDQDILRIGDTTMVFRTPANHRGAGTGNTTAYERQSVSQDQTAYGDDDPDAPANTLISEEEPKLQKTRAELKFDAQKSFLMNVEDLQNIVEVEKANTKLRILYEVNSAISTILDLQELLAKILDVVFQYTPAAERGAILLYDAQTDSLKSTVTKLRGGGSDDIKLSKTLMSRVTEEKVSLLTTDTMLDDALAAAQSIITQGIRSAMSVPLINKNDLLGVLHIDTTQKTDQFNEDALELLAGIASQAAMAIENAQLLKKVENEIATRGSLQRYLSPELVEQIVNNEMDLSVGGQLQKSTVLFTDLRGFTKMTESIGAEAVVAILNDYFERMVDIVFANGGTLDKFIGDAIMATWGIPRPIGHDSLKAAKASVLMQKELYYFNLSQKKRGLNVLKMGAGVNTGELVVGNMGSPKRMEYTVIGPPVNLSSRVESKTSHNHVFVSEYTYEEIKDQVQAVEMPHMSLKGIDRPIKIFGIYSIRDEEGCSHHFLPVVFHTSPEDTSKDKEGLIQTYDGDNLLIHTDLIPDLQQGSEYHLFVDLPNIAPEDHIAIRCLQVTKVTRPNGDEHLEIVASVGELSDSLQHFFAPLISKDSAEQTRII